MSDIAIFELSRPPVYAQPFYNFLPDTDNSIAGYLMQITSFGMEYTTRDATNGVTRTFSLDAGLWSLPIAEDDDHPDEFSFHNVFYIAAGTTATVTMDVDGMGDVDLYMRKSTWPTLTEYDCRPYRGAGITESCTLPGPGWYTYRIHGYSTTATGSVTVRYTNPYYRGYGTLQCGGNCGLLPNSGLVDGVYTVLPSDQRFRYGSCTVPVNGVVTAERGDGGAPVFNQYGQLLGIHTSGDSVSRSATAVYLGWTIPESGEQPYLDWIADKLDTIQTNYERNMLAATVTAVTYPLL